MHSVLSRLNAVSALATSVLVTLLAFVAVSTLVIPAKLEPASLKMNNLNVVLGKSPGNRKEQEFAFARFDLKADVTPLWNWNTKQVQGPYL
ncbi:MAG: hypothetical protein CYPHOPRED_000700 [Cyphobasidiales sp. Tagirdzhanova-0007]|nr:MAG: hypothetical protein CYPHOPRED_000700 [Cyphobasidiales sp. Tagirdzhanova-0007]